MKREKRSHADSMEGRVERREECVHVIELQEENRRGEGRGEERRGGKRGDETVKR